MVGNIVASCGPSDGDTAVYYGNDGKEAWWKILNQREGCKWPNKSWPGQVCKEFTNAEGNQDAGCFDISAPPPQPKITGDQAQSSENPDTCTDTPDNPYPQCGATVGLEDQPANLLFEVTKITTVCNSKVSGVRYTHDKGTLSDQCKSVGSAARTTGSVTNATGSQGTNGGASTSITSSQTSISPSQATVNPVSLLAKCSDGDNPKTLKTGEKPNGYDWKVSCSTACTKNEECSVPSDGYTDPKNNGWCYQFQEGFRCMSLKYVGATSVTPASQIIITCKGQENYDDVLNRTIQAGYTGPSDQASIIAAYNRAACPGATSTASTTPSTAPKEKEGDKTPKRITKAYRLAENTEDLANTTWQPYTVGGINVRYTFLNYRIGPKYIYIQFQDDQGKIINTTPLTATIRLVEANSVINNNTSGNANCPIDNWKSFSIPKLKELCSSLDLSKLPVEALKDFSNQDLLAIAKSVDGVNGPYQFLSQFDNNTLGSFDLDVLRKLPGSRINTLSQNLKDAISSKSTTAETASCNSIRISGNSVDTSFTGSVSSLKIWIASNSDIGNEARSVGSWSLVKTILQSEKSVGQTVQLDTTAFTKGVHAVLMSLHGSYGQMLDGNPGGNVNTKCTTTLTIQ